MPFLDSAGRRKEDHLPAAASDIGKIKATTQGGSHLNAVCPSMYHRHLNTEEELQK